MRVFARKNQQTKKWNWISLQSTSTLHSSEKKTDRETQNSLINVKDFANSPDNDQWWTRHGELSCEKGSRTRLHLLSIRSHRAIDEIIKNVHWKNRRRFLDERIPIAIPKAVAQPLNQNSMLLRSFVCSSVKCVWCGSRGVSVLPDQWSQ